MYEKKVNSKIPYFIIILCFVKRFCPFLYPHINRTMNKLFFVADTCPIVRDTYILRINLRYNTVDNVNISVVFEWLYFK